MIVIRVAERGTRGTHKSSQFIILAATFGWAKSRGKTVSSIKWLPARISCQHRWLTGKIGLKPDVNNNNHNKFMYNQKFICITQLLQNLENRTVAAYFGTLKSKTTQRKFCNLDCENEYREDYLGACGKSS